MVKANGLRGAVAHRKRLNDLTVSTSLQLAEYFDRKAVVQSAPAIGSSERGDSLARKRYQRGHVFLIGSTWYGKYREDVIEANGATRRKQATVTLGSKKEIPTKPLAKRRMELILSRINSPDYRPGRFAKMNDFAVIWQEHVLVGSKQSTIRSARSHLHVHILPHFGKRGLDEIGIQAQQFFVTKLVHANLSRKMILNVMSTLSSILQTAKGWGYVCQLVDYKSLTFMVLAMTGMRAGEMLGLQWGDIDFEKGSLQIRRSAWYGRVQTTKNKNSEAIIPLPGVLSSTLRMYQAQWKPNPDGFLFVTRNRRPPSSNKVVEYGLWPVLDLLSIPRCGLHAFRHSHASLLLDTGATPKVVQEQLRHADARITLGVYGHVLGDAHREAVEKVASIVLQNVPNAREETK
jgi:integrase